MTSASFRLVRKYIGASQTRIGIATGFDQGSVSLVVHGSRVITTIDVLDRIATGLTMPDHARIQLGLAPRGGLSALVGQALTGSETSCALLWTAAHESAVLSGRVEAAGLGPATLDHLQDDLRRLATDYVVTSDLPRILGQALLLRGRLSSLIERRRPRPREARELYLLVGATCLLLASISHDFGESDAGMTQARSAGIFAGLAEHSELSGWVLCTKAMINLWRLRPEDVLLQVAQGEATSITGSGRLRLKGLHVRALAQLNRKAEATALLCQLEDDHGSRDGSGSLADLGAVFSFPETRRHYYAAVSYAQLGDYPAVERSVAALGHDENPPTSTGSWPVSWALGRSYLALSRLEHRGCDGGPDAAAEALAPVFVLPEVQRVHQLGQVLDDIDRRLKAEAYRRDPSARALADAVRHFRSPKQVIQT